MINVINKQTISKLYNGDISPIEYCPSELKEYKSINKKTIELYNKLMDLSNIYNFIDLLVQYEDEKNKMTSLLQEHSYIEGFSLGLKLTSEAFIGNEE